MVTLITEKLQDQTLEEISTTETILGEQPRKDPKDRSNVGTVRRTSRLQHRRTLSSRATRNVACLPQDGSKLGELASSFLTTRCHSYPPAKKRLCRSLSDPYKDHEGKANWNPEPSSIWTPVKPRRSDRTKPSGARSLEFGSRETFTWSTPPESPIPRPVSANSTLEDSKFFPLRLISEERDGSQLDTVVNFGQSDECGNLSATMPRRSHSHPSFSHFSNSGLKRRLSEIDIPRPALDFDKMKARSFATKNVDKRSLKSPKYTAKRHPSASPIKNISTSKQGKTMSMLTPTVPEDLGLSLLITPTASPTADVKTFEVSKVGNKDENANRKSTSLMDYITTDSIMVDTELDINLIEEDGTLNNPTHSTMFFT